MCKWTESSITKPSIDEWCSRWEGVAYRTGARMMGRSLTVDERQDAMLAVCQSYHDWIPGTCAPMVVVMRDVHDAFETKKPREVSIDTDTVPWDGMNPEETADALDQLGCIFDAIEKLWPTWDQLEQDCVRFLLSEVPDCDPIDLDLVAKRNKTPSSSVYRAIEKVKKQIRIKARCKAKGKKR